MGLLGTLARGMGGPRDRVVLHILDATTGYSSRVAQVGREVDPDTVRRLAEGGALYVLVSYEGGAPSAAIISRARWLRARQTLEAPAEPVDPAVWRPREELDVAQIGS